MPDNTEQRFCELYDRLETPLFNTVYRWLWHREESQDIVQQAFLACWKQRRDWQAGDLKPYVFAIALNLAKKRLRWQSLRQWVGLEEIESTLADDLPDMYAEQAQVKQCLKKMPPALREALLLVEIGGLTYAETAAALKIGEGTVGSRRHRALAWLKNALDLHSQDSNPS